MAGSNLFISMGLGVPCCSSSAPICIRLCKQWSCKNLEAEHMQLLSASTPTALAKEQAVTRCGLFGKSFLGPAWHFKLKQVLRQEGPYIFTEEQAKTHTHTAKSPTDCGSAVLLSSFGCVKIGNPLPSKGPTSKIGIHVETREVPAFDALLLKRSLPPIDGVLELPELQEHGNLCGVAELHFPWTSGQPPAPNLSIPCGWILRNWEETRAPSPVGNAET